MKLWAGRTSGKTDSAADDFNSSIRFDQKMYRQDIRGSIAHAKMLAKQGILTETEAQRIVRGLTDILGDLETGRLSFDPGAEDIHMFIEQELTARIGEDGKRLHTARSRNDQVALDLRLYLRDACGEILRAVHTAARALLDKAKENTGTILPGYTHLQRAQPVLFAQHLLAYDWMLIRDAGRIRDAVRRMNASPIGACALSGTTYDTDRRYEAEELGFDSVCPNSMDAVSDRDFALEVSAACSILMMHLSRLSEELILWSSWEFRFVELDDDYTTGSSIMPQKKNPDMAELIRGKTGRVYGDLMSLLTVMKGLPLCYNKDMQEDKEAVFDAVDTVLACLGILSPMIATMRVNRENMKAAAQKGFINATDLADYLTQKKLPFRDAYRIAGRLVNRCIREGRILEDMPLEAFREESSLFEADVYECIALERCVKKRISEGGTGPDSVLKQIADVEAYLSRENR